MSIHLFSKKRKREEMSNINNEDKIQGLLKIKRNRREYIDDDLTRIPIINLRKEKTIIDDPWMNSKEAQRSFNLYN